MLLQLATVRVFFFTCFQVPTFRFVLHLQDWWCIGKRKTSFPINELWLIYLLPSLWPLTTWEQLYF